MPRRTRQEIELRLREVEHALLTYPWTLDTQAIVQYYPEAVRLLELAGETPTKVLEASYTDEGA